MIKVKIVKNYFSFTAYLNLLFKLLSLFDKREKTYIRNIIWNKLSTNLKTKNWKTDDSRKFGNVMKNYNNASIVLWR